MLYFAVLSPLPPPHGRFCDVTPYRLVLLSSLAKPELTPIVKFKADFVLPVVEAIGFLVPFVAQSLFAVAHLPDVVRRDEA